MNTKHNTTDTVQSSRDALFRAPGWAAKWQTFAAMLGVLAVVSLAVGAGLGIVSANGLPILFGLVLCAFCAMPAYIIWRLVDRSIGEVYSGAPVQAPGPQSTVLVLERSLPIDGKPQPFGQDRVTINAPADEVSRMLAWIKDNPDRTSRAQVMQNARVKQTTWERVMAALEEVGAVVGGGKSGYTVTDALDDKLSRLEARL